MSLSARSGKPVEIFYSYSHKDEKLRNKLETHLSLLKQQGLVINWHDRKISAGSEWANEIDFHLNTADIILLLISPDFLASSYCYGIEMKRALARHKKGEAVVIPVILRPVHWEEALFGKLQALPTEARPITGRFWHNQDEAFYNVAEGIRKVTKEIAEHSEVVSETNSESLLDRKEIYSLYPKRFRKIEDRDLFNILIVEDDRDIGQALNLYLKYSRYNTSTARDGSEILEKIEQFQPDLILLDLAMSSIGGLEFIRQLRLHHYDVPVILLTASDNFFISKALELGANGYITKPTQPEKVVTNIDSFLRYGVWTDNT